MFESTEVNEYFQHLKSIKFRLISENDFILAT
jgi:hypothetical protein